ncbi:unnamed protein product [Amoebophrya sp. A25]|nr:unnamed protein product [Amoebophrya sp. A25]|eukprot:GSA25T00003719001.1
MSRHLQPCHVGLAATRGSRIQLSRRVLLTRSQQRGRSNGCGFRTFGTGAQAEGDSRLLFTRRMRRQGGIAPQDTEQDAIPAPLIQHQVLRRHPERVFVLPGLLGSTDNWVPAARKLSEDLPERDFFLVDQRNHGKSFHDDENSYASMVGDLHRLAFASRGNGDSGGTGGHWKSHGGRLLQKVALIGHSLGGKTSMRFALQYPELVSRLVVVDISPRTFPGAYFVLLLSHLLATPKELAAKGRAGVEEWMVDGSSEENLLKKNRNFLEMAFELETSNGQTSAACDAFLADCGKELEKLQRDLKTDKHFRAFLLKNLATAKGDGGASWRPNLRALLRNYRPHFASGFEDAELASLLPEVENEEKLEALKNLPVLVVRGGESQYVRLGTDVERFRKLFPQVQVETVEGAGHWPHATHTKEVVNFIRKFFEN